MTSYQQRVMVEKAELDEKLSKLTAFLQSETFAGLDKAEAERLLRQAKVMHEYSAILGERISAFMTCDG